MLQSLYLSATGNATISAAVTGILGGECNLQGRIEGRKVIEFIFYSDKPDFEKHQRKF